MPLIGGKTGFKTVRDAIFCGVGMAIVVFHVYTLRNHPGDLSFPLLMFGGGLAGSPYVLRQDEKKG